MKVKRILALLTILAVAALGVSACGKSGNEKSTTAAPATTAAAPETTTAAPTTTAAATESTTAAPETTAAATESTTTAAPAETEAATEEETTAFVPITEGSIDLTAASVDLADGWYVKEEPTDKEVTLKNDSIKNSMAYVTITCTSTFQDEGAQHWVEATQRNLSGKGEIGNATYNGVEYYTLKNYTNDGKQSVLFADSSDGKNWIKVSVMFMTYEDAEPLFEHITIK